MGFSKISADADFGGGVWHILPSGEHREWSPLGVQIRNRTSSIKTRNFRSKKRKNERKIADPVGTSSSSRSWNGSSCSSRNGSSRRRWVGEGLRASAHPSPGPISSPWHRSPSGAHHQSAAGHSSQGTMPASSHRLWKQV